MIAPQPFTLWRHKKTGGIYTVILNCRIEATDTPAVAYQKEGDCPAWVRPLAEFMDGRFEWVNRNGDPIEKRETTP